MWRWQAQETTIRNWRFREPSNLTIHERDSKKWPSMESDRTGFKIGWQGFLRRHEASTVKLYVSEILSEKCITWKRGWCGSLEVIFYIAEVRVLFVGHRTMEVQSRARLPGNLRSEKWLGMEWESGRLESWYKCTSANVNPWVRQPTQEDILIKTS